MLVNLDACRCAFLAAKEISCLPAQQRRRRDPHNNADSEETIATMLAPTRCGHRFHAARHTKRSACAIGTASLPFLHYKSHVPVSREVVVRPRRLPPSAACAPDPTSIRKRKVSVDRQCLEVHGLHEQRAHARHRQHHQSRHDSCPKNLGKHYCKTSANLLVDPDMIFCPWQHSKTDPRHDFPSQKHGKPCSPCMALSIAASDRRKSRAPLMSLAPETCSARRDLSAEYPIAISISTASRIPAVLKTQCNIGSSECACAREGRRQRAWGISRPKLMPYLSGRVCR